MLLVLLLAIVAPVVLIAMLSYFRIQNSLTAVALSRRESIAYLAASTVRAELSRHCDIGVSLATRVRFRELIREEKWGQAIQILRSVPKDFPSIERVFLADLHGTLMADSPELPGVRGRNFAFRDWYRGIRETGKPYVSEVYQRAAEPRFNVFAVAVPISSENGEAIGILVLQVRAHALLGWIPRVEIGPEGNLYVVDRKGHVAAHPKLKSDGEIQDASALSPVRKVLQGGRGIEILSPSGDKERRIYAYEPVSGYAWGVIAEQPVSSAFAARNAALRNLLLAYVLIVVISGCLTWAILRTLVERRTAEERIQRLNEDLLRRAAALDATNKELEAFSYSVSHDLRAPLRSIDGFSQALLEDCAGALEEQGKESLRRIRAATQRMGQLIDDLLTLSRLTRTEMSREELDLATLAGRIVQELRSGQPERDVEFRAAKELVVEGDRRLLGVMLENLLRNAWKFTRHRAVAHIELGSLEQNGSRIFFLRDDGAGFDMAYVDKLFGAFQRLHSEKEFEGTGIGLATVARIIHRHGGRVWAEGAPEGGATFYFTLQPSTS